MNDKDMMSSPKLTAGDFGSTKPDPPPDPFYYDISYTSVMYFDHIHPLISLFCSTPTAVSLFYFPVSVLFRSLVGLIRAAHRNIGKGRFWSIDNISVGVSPGSTSLHNQ